MSNGQRYKNKLSRTRIASCLKGSLRPSLSRPRRWSKMKGMTSWQSVWARCRWICRCSLVIRTIVKWRKSQWGRIASFLLRGWEDERVEMCSSDLLSFFCASRYLPAFPTRSMNHPTLLLIRHSRILDSDWACRPTSQFLFSHHLVSACSDLFLGLDTFSLWVYFLKIELISRVLVQNIPTYTGPVYSEWDGYLGYALQTSVSTEDTQYFFRGSWWRWEEGD